MSLLYKINKSIPEQDIRKTGILERHDDGAEHRRDCRDREQREKERSLSVSHNKDKVGDEREMRVGMWGRLHLELTPRRGGTQLPKKQCMYYLGV